MGRRADNKEEKVTENDVLMGRIVVLLTEVFDLKKSVELERDSKDVSTFRKGQLISKCLFGVLNFFQKNRRKHVTQQGMRYKFESVGAGRRCILESSGCT